MTTKNQANQILQSLESLDQAQAEKVLNYIKGLKHPDKDANYQKRVKHEAMMQIRQALSKARALNPAF
jgi:hypothetical protein